MSKKNKKNEPVIDLEITPDKVGTEVKEETSKKLLKSAEKIVRRLDNIVSDLYALRNDAMELSHGEAIVTTEIAPKDRERFSELFTVLDGAVGILYMLDARMARKYVGKEISDLDNDRNSLKR